VTHGQCDARPTVTFPVAERHRPLAGAKLYCLVTEAHGCEQLGQSCYSVADWPGVELATFRSRANALTTRQIGYELFAERHGNGPRAALYVLWSNESLQVKVSDPHWLIRRDGRWSKPPASCTQTGVTDNSCTQLSTIMSIRLYQTQHRYTTEAKTDSFATYGPT